VPARACDRKTTNPLRAYQGEIKKSVSLLAGTFCKCEQTDYKNR